MRSAPSQPQCQNQPHLRPRRPRSGRRGLVIATVALLGLVSATHVHAQSDRGNQGNQRSGRADPQLQTPETAAVVAGDTSWVALNWLGDGDARNFQVRVENAIGANRATWEYPTNSGNFTSLSKDAELLDGELDYTAIRLTVPYAQDRSFQLNLRVTWEDGRGGRSETARVTVPVTSFSGEDFQQITNEAQVASAEDTWVEVRYTGGAPVLDDVSLTVADTGGLDIVYPGDDDATSLHHDGTLLAGETDVARFLVLGTGADPGSRQLALEVSYRKGDAVETRSTALAVQVG